MKKFRFILILLLIGVMACSLIACDREDDDPDAGLLEGDLIISAQEQTLKIGDEVSLRVMIGDEPISCEWSSSDANVVTVEGKGKLKAHNLGTATVTAKYGSRSATCNVIVNLGGQLPALQLNCTSDGNLQIDNKHTVSLDGMVVFNNNEYTDVTYSYQLSDPTLGTIANGIFTPAKVGEGKITVTASWRGIQSDLLTQVINVKIIKSVAVLVNEDPNLADVSLYASANFDDPAYTIPDKTFATSVPFDAQVLVEGNKYQMQVVSNDTDVVEYDNITKTLVAQGRGETTVEISYSQDDVQIFKTINVKVDVPVAKYQYKVPMFSAMDGDLVDSQGNDLLATLFGGDNSLHSALELDTILDVSTGKILGVATSSAEITKTTITVYGKKLGYVIDLEGYTKVIDDANDLKALQITEGNKVLSGYFILAQDVTIDESDGTTFTVNTSSWNTFQNSWFAGIFDGNGHKIINYPVRSEHSLFGRLEDATVKDVAFVDVLIMDTNSRLFGCMSGYSRQTLFSNVFMSFKSGSASAQLNDRQSQYAIFGDQHTSYLKLDNVVIAQDFVSETPFNGPSGQGVGFFCRELNPSTRPSMTNVYFVAPVANNGRIAPIFQSPTQTIYGANVFTDFGEGDKVFLDSSHNPIAVGSGSTRTFYRYSGVSQYQSLAKMAEAGKSVVGSWNISSGAPVWSPVVEAE